jgi:hypothetical protein
MTLAQLASGARIVSRPDPVLAASLSEWVTWVEGATDVQAVVAAASPLDRREVRALLRTLFEHHSTAAALRRLLRSLGLGSASATADDVCAFVRIDPDVRVDRIVDDILRQRRRPTEAIFVGDVSDLQDAVIEELRLAGIATSRMPATSEPAGDMAEAASRVRAGWLWPMARDQRYPSHHVLDLVIAAQISGAAAVGLTDGSDDGFVTVLPHAMSIVARLSAARLPDPTVHGLGRWFAMGATLFGLGSPAT